jgi:hypothetical protein
MPAKAGTEKGFFLRRALLPLAALLSLSACGFYTAIPAQIHASVTPGSVAYSAPDATGVLTDKVTQPTLILTGEPGSIGMTFNFMTVDYLGADGKVITNLAELVLRNTIRLEASQYPQDPAGPNIDFTKVGTSLHVAQTTVPLPLITRALEIYGSSSGAAPVVTAQMLLSGTDDANFPTPLSGPLTVDVPITFNATK